MGGGDGNCYRTARRAQKARVVLLKQVEKGEGRKEEGKKGVIIGIQGWHVSAGCTTWSLQKTL